MSQVVGLENDPDAPVAEPRRRRVPRVTPARLLVLAALGLALFSAVRILSGASELTSSGTVNAAVGLAVPIGMAGLGGLWSERAGVVNIGLEGMMILGTFGAGWIGWQAGPWVGILCAIAFGAVGGLVHAIATVTFGVDHIVSGVAINILGLGVTQFLASLFLVGTPGGGETQSPQVDSVGQLSIPFIREPLGWIEDQGWFFVSDLAGVLRGLFTSVSYLTVIAALLIVGTYFVLWHTPFGLRLRSCGEDPYAAESLGVKVYLHKYVAVMISGALAGFGGAYLVIVAASVYREGQTAGRGYIGLAAMIFGNWRPGGLAAGSGLFGYTNAVQLRNAEAVHALLLLAAICLAVLTVVLVMRRRVVPAVVAAAVGALCLVWYLATDTLPPQVTFMTPYLATLLVLALATQRLRMPKADGLIYRKGASR